MISICTTIKNRSRVKLDNTDLFLFPNFVRSVVESIDPKIQAELVVADWSSDDWPLKDWLVEAAKQIPVQIINLQGDFSIGQGRNMAASAAKGDVLLFLDADCLLSKEVVNFGLDHLKSGKAFFPVLYSYKEPTHQSGWWRHEGYGNCMVDRRTYELAGKWPEFRQWGKEDDIFFKNVEAKCEIVRKEIPGFYHQWHPNDIAWKNRYSVRADDIAHEVQNAQAATEMLMKIIPQEAKFILVDEARFGDDSVPQRYSIPFTEKNGEYAGPPIDDTVAIQELDRLHQNGAGFIAFVWVSFWWLEYYKGFREYLEKNFKCILRTDLLIVFDLFLKS